MWQKNAFTEKVGLQWPIIQGPFGGGLSSVALTAAVSNHGGLGSFGAHYMTPTQIEDLCKDIRAKTNKPFAVNLWVSDHDPEAEKVTPERFEEFKSYLKPIYEKLSVPLPTYPQKFGENFEEQVEAILKSRPPVFSFVFGVPSKEVLQECRKNKILTVGTAVTVEEALALDAADVDVIVASGFEAGGHRGAFLKAAEDSLMGTMSLLPQVVDRVHRPVISGGGVTDGRGIAASLMLGASGVQIGTAFLACEESNATENHKNLLRSKKLLQTKLTRAFSGRLARGIENKMMHEMGQDLTKIAPYPVQTWLTRNFKDAAATQNAWDYVALWASQSFPQIKHRKAEDLLKSLIQETEVALQKFYSGPGK